MKQLTLIPIGGLANRFYAITSAIAFCKDYDIKLKVIWFKDKGMGADFHSLFELSEDVDKSNVEIIDAKWYHYVYDRPRKRNLWLTRLFQVLFFSPRSYDKDLSDFNIDNFFNNGHNGYLVHCSPFYSYYKLDNLILKKTIVDKVNEIISFWKKKSVIGIHIRRTDNIYSISHSPLELFVKAIDLEIENNPDVIFYVASDSLEEKIKLKSKYNERIITSLQKTQRNTQYGILNAVVELYVLSKTSKIYGSSYSTFSKLAADISGIELNILSLDMLSSDSFG